MEQVDIQYSKNEQKTLVRYGNGMGEFYDYFADINKSACINNQIT